MLLNRVEYALMNNPLRPLVQRHFEARRLLRVGGRLHGGRALEIGCGSGAGAVLILEVFGAVAVDAFDLDPRMVRRARARLARHGSQARVWVGDAECIAAQDAAYDAVFDFGIIHHVPRWRRALAEVERVLKPGGSFYAEEVFAGFVDHPLTRVFLDHPRHDRFDRHGFREALAEVGFQAGPSEELWHSIGWFSARKPEAG